MNSLPQTKLKALNIANKMIYIYTHTGVEQYPEARALDVLDAYSLNDPDRIQAYNLFTMWLEMRVA